MDERQASHRADGGSDHSRGAGYGSATWHGGQLITDNVRGGRRSADCGLQKATVNLRPQKMRKQTGGCQHRGTRIQKKSPRGRHRAGMCSHGTRELGKGKVLLSLCNFNITLCICLVINSIAKNWIYCTVSTYCTITGI